MPVYFKAVKKIDPLQLSAKDRDDFLAKYLRVQSPDSYGHGSNPVYSNKEAADACAEMTKHLHRHNELPLIVEFAEAIAGVDFGLNDLKNLAGKKLHSIQDEYKLDILVDGEIKASYDFSDQEDEAENLIADYLEDWGRLAKNIDMKNKLDKPASLGLLEGARNFFGF